MQSRNTESYFIDECSHYVTDFFEKELPEWAVYHNLCHTIETLEGCKEIGIGEGIKKDEIELLIIAAWFHDTGYAISVENHENISCNIAKEFLTDIKYPDSHLKSVLKLILATKTSHKPKSLLEYIIRDADLISLGREDYLISNDLLKREIELRDNLIIADEAWLERSINFLLAHKYFTRYAQLKYGPAVENNLESLRKFRETKHTP
jgi:hypothetical protein